jgi:hypothetical protein
MRTLEPSAVDLPLPPPTRYDQAARYLLQRAGALLFYWLLHLTPAQLRFERWLPTQLTLPGTRQRLCDGIAHLADLQHGGRPFAAILEVQTEPDATMPGRLMLAGGLLWLTVKPTQLPGDRYELLGVVINLTGRGDATRGCVLGTAEWILRPIEVNLETLDAGEVLEQIASQQAPAELLAFIPLLHRGDETGIIQRWSELVGAETDLRRRADYALALVFAERAGRRDAWHDALKGFAMIESPLIAELLAKAEADATVKATAKATAEALLRVLQKRYRELPEAVTTAIRACTDSAQLDRWLDAAGEAPTLEQFRQQTGL